MTQRRRSIVKLKGTDAALVIHETGQVVVHLPDFEPGDDVPEHVVLLMSIAEHIQNSEFVEHMLEAMKECDCPSCAQPHGLPN